MKGGNFMLWAVLLTFALGAGSFADDNDDDESPHPSTPAKGKAAPAAKTPAEEKKFRDYNDVVRDATKIEGFFTLQRKDEHLYIEITPHQFDHEFLVPVTLARGLAHAGWPLGDNDTLVLYFHRAGDKVQLVRKNFYFKAPDKSPLEKAVKQNYTDSVLMALPIVSIHHGGNQAVLVDLADVFLSDFAGIGIGHLDRNRTTWHKIKGFPNNVEIEVEATFAGFGGHFGFGGNDPTADARGRTVVIHYSLAKMPEHGYHSRPADDRVGFFLNTYKDFGSDDPDSNAVRYVNRWRLEKADHKAKLSPPKKQIVWYVEDTVPHEYRPAVEEGIREWNKAFEKIGFRDAVAVRWQEPGRDDFDPEDINYCTFRWITTAETFAMSCLRSNPMTGEMIDGDVIFDASWVRTWKQQYAFLTGTVSSPTPGAAAHATATETLAVGRILSPIKAAKEGFGLPMPLPRAREALLAESTRAGVAPPELVPAGWTELDHAFRRRQGSGRFLACQLSTGLRGELGLAVLALAAADQKGKDKEKVKDKDKEEMLPEGLLNQLIKEVVMHEVGHSLGLRHNFKASAMLTAEQLNDPAVTKVKGQSGSVMDYNPINIAPRGQKQGEYVTSTLGPYDYWAIEYAYKPIDGDEEAELKKLSARSPEPDLIFATDEDMFLNDDPLVNTYDLGSDPLRFARDRIALASDLVKDLDAKIVRDGDAFTRVRDAFAMLLNQWGNASYLVAAHIGGQSVARDHKGKGARDPVVPVSVAKQREALALLVDQILSDKAFKFPPALLRRLSSDHWHDWGSGGVFSSGGNVEYPLNEEILGIQKIALGHCLGANVLSRLQNQELQVDAGADALRLAEVFRVLSDGVWSEVANPPAKADAKPSLALSTVRRNLQREHLRRLSTIVLGTRRNPFEELYGYVIFFNSGTYPADARSLAHMHLTTIVNRIGPWLGGDVTVDDTTRAHLQECVFKIKKVLDAGIQSNEP